MENTKLQQEDTVSADRKERIIFDQNTGKSRKISSVVSRQNFNNKKYGNRNSPIEFVDGKEPPPEETKEVDNKMKKEDMNIVTKILEAKKKKKEPCAEEVVELDTELTEQLQEVLTKDAKSAEWIHDFVHSDNPKFEGKSKKERIKMALGAYYAKQRNEEHEAHVTEACKSIVKAATKKSEMPFDGPYTKSQETVTDKSGAKHTPMSRARNLARQGMKEVQKEETDLDEAKNYPYTYRATYHDPDTDKLTHVMDFKHRSLDAAKKHAEGSRLERRDGKQDKLHSVEQMKEEVESIDELSKGTLGSYINKAAKDMSYEANAAGFKEGVKKPMYNASEDTPKEIKREKGISTAVKKLTKEETDMSEKLTYTQFVEQLLEYTPGAGGVTKVQGRSYGAQYHDPEGADDAWENEGKAKPAAAAPAAKKGRGRPSGSYGTYKARSAETKAAAAAKSAASKAANKAK